MRGRVRALQYLTGASDVAEIYESNEELGQGEVVEIDPQGAEKIRRARARQDGSILAVISTEPGFILGDPTDEEVAAMAGEEGHSGGMAAPRRYPVALVGRAPVRVSPENGPIRIGDPLTISSRAGVAMRATRPGPVLGRSLGEWRGPGAGTVVAWVTPGAAGTDDSARGGTDGRPKKKDDDQGAILDPAEADEGSPGEARPAVATAHIAGAWLPVGHPVEVGDVVVADRGSQGAMSWTILGADTAVIGVVSEDPSAPSGETIPFLSTRGQEPEIDLTNSVPRLDLFQTGGSGIAPCKVDAGYGAIQIGDLLVTSPTEGHAMRADDPSPGTVVGKALEPWEAGTGRIRTLIMLR
jgi:hypothetical protein